MDTKNLNVFIQINEAGSVQGAARRLGLSRSALRRCVDELEAEVGTPLFHRDPTGVRLTPAGAVTLAEGKALLASAQGLVANARTAGREPRGTLRVISPVGMPLAMQVSALLATHISAPRQQIVIRQAENPLSILNEPFELMLHEGPAPDRNSWYSCVVLRVPLRLVAARDYLAQRGTPQSVTELAEHDTLGWCRPGIAADRWPLIAGGEVAISPWFSTADPQLMVAVAARGGGIALAPRLPFFEEPDPFEVLLEDEVGTELVFRVTTPFPHRADARTRETLERILAQLEGLPRD